MSAGGESLGGGGKTRRGGNSKRKTKKRLGFRLDMTPLVDITFLLLTFFMLTTSMLTPQTLQLNVPREETEIDVKCSELMTIRIRPDGAMFYNVCTDEPVRVTLKELRKVVTEQNIALKNKLIVSLKASPDGMYGRVAEVLDILRAAEPDIIAGLNKIGIEKRDRKFTVAPWTDEDTKETIGL